MSHSSNPNARSYTLPISKASSSSASLFSFNCFKVSRIAFLCASNCAFVGPDVPPVGCCFDAFVFRSVPSLFSFGGAIFVLISSSISVCNRPLRRRLYSIEKRAFLCRSLGKFKISSLLFTRDLFTKLYSLGYRRIQIMPSKRRNEKSSVLDDDESTNTTTNKTNNISKKAKVMMISKQRDGGGKGGGTNAKTTESNVNALTTDALNASCFTLRKARNKKTREKAFTLSAQKSFRKVGLDEDTSSVEERKQAMGECWRKINRKFESVLREANLEAFSKIQEYVEETFRKRLEDSETFGMMNEDDDDSDDDDEDEDDGNVNNIIRRNKEDDKKDKGRRRSRLPPHFAESLPTGLVLAGGVNADDHEETFASLAKFLAKSDFHCALLQSKDVKTRKSGFGGGIGGGGMNNSSGGSTTFASSAASRGILGDCVSLVARQLESRNAAPGGVSLEDFLNPREHHLGGGGSTQTAASSGGSGVKTVRHIARWYESTLVGGSEQQQQQQQQEHNNNNNNNNETTNENNNNANGMNTRDKNTEKPSYSLRRERVETLPKILGRPRPVVVLVSDVEGFQGSSALSDLLASFSSFHRDVPFILLLGIATNTSALQRSIPSETASKLRPKVFKLFAPTDASREIREKIFLDPTLYPALGNDALTYLHTRFMEHDFSLTTMRRSVKVLYLNHFATERLSYVNKILNERDYSADTTKHISNGEGPRETRELLRESEKLYSNGSEEALKWYLERFCGLILSRKDQKSVEMLKELFLNSEIRGHGEEEGKEEEEDEKEEEQEKEDKGGAKGKTNDDIFNAFTENMLQVGENRKKFAIGLDVLSLISRRVGYQRWSRTADVLLDCAFPSFFFVSKRKQQQKNRAMTAANAREHQQQEQQEQQEKSTTTKKAFVTEGEKILRLLSSRVERAVRAAVSDVKNNNEITTAAPIVATAATSSSAITTLSLKDLCRDCAKVCEGHEEIRANEGAQFSKLLARLEKEENVTTTTNVTTATTSSSLTPVQTFEQIVRSVVKNYASKPPESLPGKKIFCVTSADAARETFSAAPRMALETALSNPSEALECQCCPKSGEISASLPDPCLCYKLLENFGGESANAFELFRRFIMEHRDTSDEELGLLLKEDQDKMKKKKRTKRGEKEEEEDVEAPPPPPTNNNSSKKKQKHTFGLDKRKVWALQARFTRACSELEFLGMASARRHKKVEFLVRTAFPLDFASK